MYTVLGAFWASSTMAFRFYDLFIFFSAVASQKQTVDPEMVPGIVNFAAAFVVSFVFAIVLGVFTAWHLHMISRNETTIERLEKREKLKRYLQVHDPYNLGFRENLRALFGRKWQYWLLPVQTIEGDGLSFPIRASSNPNSSSDNSGHTVDQMRRKRKKSPPLTVSDSNRRDGENAPLYFENPYRSHIAVSPVLFNRTIPHDNQNTSNDDLLSEREASDTTDIAR